MNWLFDLFKLNYTFSLNLYLVDSIIVNIELQFRPRDILPYTAIHSRTHGFSVLIMIGAFWHICTYRILSTNQKTFSQGQNLWIYYNTNYEWLIYYNIKIIDRPIGAKKIPNNSPDSRRDWGKMWIISRIYWSDFFKRSLNFFIHPYRTSISTGGSHFE